MKFYKIYYKDEDGIISEYDRVNYPNYSSAEKIMENAQEQFPNKKFNIYEVEIK